MKKVKIILIVIVSTIFLTTCRKDFPRQMAIEIKSETHTFNSAEFSLNIADLGGNSTVEYGICYSISSATPTITESKHWSITDSVGNEKVKVFGLKPCTIYYVRAYVRSDEITEYGSVISFTTADIPDCGTVIDFDGNTYNTVNIGTQCWMRENLKVTHYRNGDAIPNVIDGTAWSNLTSGAYCNYDNSLNNATTYGRLYNWYAVSDSRNIAPVGWHVPTDAEWSTLITYLGGESTAGCKLMEAGTTHWASPYTGTTNETGFSALPGGYRNYMGGEFNLFGYGGFWWSTTEYSTAVAWYRSMNCGNGSVSTYRIDKEDGYSVRCVKD
jgi:uncharacterized protein (TIGR02145 family)